MAKYAGVLGVGAYLPERVLTNQDLEKIVETTDEWIITRTGIKERRIAPPQMFTSDLAARAAEKALKDAGLDAGQIEAIVLATISGDMPCPATACIVQEKIKAKNAACFDVNAACTGFIYALSVARGFILSQTYKYVLVIAAEKTSAIVDWQDRSTCVLFGDGAGAVVLGPQAKPGILSICLGADGSEADLLKIPAGGSKLPPSIDTVKQKLHTLKMSGNEVFKLAVKTMAAVGEKAVGLAGLKTKDINCFIPHQANMRIINATAKRMGIPREKLFLNIEKYGNMSAASVAVGLAEAITTKRVKKGGYVALVAFGSGLTWGACVLKC